MYNRENSLKKFLIKALIFVLILGIVWNNQINTISALISENHKFDDSIFDSVGRYEFNIFGNSNTYGVDHYIALEVPTTERVNVQNKGVINASLATYTKGPGEIKQAFLIYSSSDFHIRDVIEQEGILDTRTIAPNGQIDLKNYPMTLIAPSGEILRAIPDYLSDPNENPSERTAILDVTDFIKRNGAGVYTGKDISYINANEADPIASWEVIVIEENPSLPFRKTVVNAGASIVSRNTSKSLTVYQPGLRTKSSGNITGQILVTGDGGNDMTIFGEDYGTLIQYSNNTIVATDRVSDGYHEENDFFRGMMTKNGVQITDINPNWTNFRVRHTSGDSNKDIYLNSLQSPLLKNDVDKFVFKIDTKGDTQHVNLIALTVDIEYPIINMTISNNASANQYAGNTVTNVVNIATSSQNKSGLWDSKLIIPMPQGTEFVENSVVVDGVKISSSAYTYNNQTRTLTIPVGPGSDHVFLGPNITSLVNFSTITSTPGAVTLDANLDGKYMGVDSNKEDVILKNIAKTSITYPVQAPINPIEDTAITGKGFIVYVADVAGLTDQMVLEKSTARAWKLSDGTDLTGDLTVDKSKVKPEIGPYPATLSVNGVNHTIIISVIDPDNTTVGPNGPNNSTNGSNNTGNLASDTVIYGKGFTIKVSDAAGLTNQNVLDKSSAKAWKLSDGTDLTGQLVVNKTAVQPIVGQYPATLSVNGVIHTITIKVIGPSINPLSPGDTSISGKGTPGDTIDLTLPNGNVIQNIPIDNSGNWTTNTTTPLQPGDKVTAIEKAPDGTVSDPIDATVSGSQNSTINTTAPNTTAPNTTAPNTTAPNTTAPNTTAPNTTAPNTTAPNTTAPNTTAPNTTAPNTTAPNTTAPNTTAPNTTATPIKPKPTIDPLNPGDTSISGKGTPGDKIDLTLPNGTVIPDIPVDNNGNWETDIPKPLKPGDEVTAIEKTPGGITSDPEKAKVPESQNSTANTTASNTTNVTLNTTSSPKPKPTIDPLYPGDTSISGTGTPGDKINLTLPDGTVIPNIPIDDNGKWHTNTQVPLKPGDEVTAIEKTPGGITSDPEKAKVPENQNTTKNTTSSNTTANPVKPKPTIDPLNPGDTSISGKGTPGDKIDLTLPDGTVIPNIPVDENGRWETDIPKSLKPGDEVIVVENTPDGKKSDPEKASVPLNPPIINGPINPTDTTIKGKGDPEKTVVVTFPDGATQKTTVDQNGNWSVNVPDGTKLKPDDIIKAHEEDDKGNKSKDATEKVIDSSKPKPTIDPIKPGDTSISGKGTPGNKISITLPDGTVISDILVDENGNWKTNIPTPLRPGEEVIAIESTPNGKKSDPEKAKVPDLPKTPVIDGPIKPNDEYITGKGEAGKTIVVTFPDGSTKTTIVDTDGTWKIKIPDGVILYPGDIIKAHSEDEYGNKSSDAVANVEDNNKPSPPTINPITPGDTSVSGKGTRGNTIDVILPDGTIISNVPVDENGNWKTNIPVPIKPGDVIKAIERSPDGTPSDPAYVKAPELPKTPTINGPINTTDSKVTGLGTSGNTIVVTFPDGNQVSTIVKSNGTWEVAVPYASSLIAGSKVRAYETDKNGNKSPDATALIIDSKTSLPTTGEKY